MIRILNRTWQRKYFNSTCIYLDIQLFVMKYEDRNRLGIVISRSFIRQSRHRNHLLCTFSEFLNILILVLANCSRSLKASRGPHEIVRSVSSCWAIPCASMSLLIGDQQRNLACTECDSFGRKHGTSSHRHAEFRQNSQPEGSKRTLLFWCK